MELDEGLALDLLRACATGNASRARTLLEQGVDPDACSVPRQVALCAAAESGHAEVVALLLDHGANPSAQNEEGQTALLCACECGEAQVVSLLLSRDVDVNEVDNNNRTALHTCAIRGSTSCASLLLERGANVQAADSSAFTPLDYAVRLVRLQTAAVLILHGADPAARGPNETTALVEFAACARARELPETEVEAAIELFKASRRDWRWSLRWPLMSALFGSGLIKRAAESAAAVIAAEQDTSSSIEPVSLDTPEKRLAHLRVSVFGTRDLLRRVMQFI